MILQIKNLVASYDTPSGELKAVDGVSLDITENEIMGIAGESGCGKTTLALSAIRLLKPPGYIKEGEITFKGEDFLRKSDEEIRQIRMKEISYIPQSSMHALNPTMRIKDQLRDMMETHIENIESREVTERVKETLGMVGLEAHVANLYPHELSGGMRQRVIIAMAILLGPELVIADEPTTALDVIVQRGILVILKDIKEKLGKSIMLITHDMAAQAEVADRMAVMYAGKIVEVGDVTSLYKQPLHPYTQLLISSIPALGSEKPLESIAGFPPDLRNPPQGCRFHPRCPKGMSGTCDRREPQLLPAGNGRAVACLLYRK